MAISDKQIAGKLGISPSTVSLVLNNKPGISQATRQRVFDALDELGCSDRKPRGSTFASASVSFIIYKTHGKVLTDTPFFSQLIEGLQEQCGKYGHHLHILYANEAITRASLPTECVGAIVLATEMTSADMAPIKELGLPFLVLDCHFLCGEFDSVTIDNVQGAFIATEHLIEMGHKKLGHFRSSTLINNFIERREGFLLALRNAKISKESSTEISVEPTVDGAYRDMCAVLDRGIPLATAYFADNDIIATGCIRALKEHGIRLPEDVSVIGFDDMPMCEAIEPPLSTVRVPKQRMGMLAVERLMSRINRETGEYVRIAVKTSLIIRDSVSRKK